MRALLDRELSRSGLSFAQWTALVFTNGAGLSIDQIAQRQLAGHVVASEAEAHDAVARLLALGALTSGTSGTDGSVQHSARGRELFERLSLAVDRITNTLYGDLSPVDLEATHRTLSEVAARANKLLSAR
jgi:DNA-binding MarR family transcriptional regulator